MVFKGVGMVRRHGQVIANFVDGKFETDRPGVILRLQQLGFAELKPAETKAKAPVAAPRAKTPRIGKTVRRKKEVAKS